MDSAKITLGELREKYEKAVNNDVVSIFIGDTEVYVSIIKDILADFSQFEVEDETEIEIGQTNIFDER